MVVGSWWLVVSQRVIRVTLRKTFRNHVNEAGEGSSAAKLFALGISWFNTCNCAWLLITAQQLNCVGEIQIGIRSEAKTAVKAGCINYKCAEIIKIAMGGYPTKKYQLKWQNEKTSDSRLK